MAQKITSRLSDQVIKRVITGLREYHEGLCAQAAETKSGEEKKVLLEEGRKTLVLINDVETGMYDYGLCEKCGKEIAYGLTDKDPLRRVCGTCETDQTLAVLEEKKAALKQEFYSWREKTKGSFRETEKTIGKDLGDTNVCHSTDVAMSKKYYAKIILAEELIASIKTGECRYGICDCGEKISKVRLQLEPFTKSCKNCLEEAERGGRKTINGGWSKKPLTMTVRRPCARR